jgi:hypothetical protein
MAAGNIRLPAGWLVTYGEWTSPVRIQSATAIRCWDQCAGLLFCVLRSLFGGGEVERR